MDGYSTLPATNAQGILIWRSIRLLFCLTIALVCAAQRTVAQTPSTQPAPIILPLWDHIPNPTTRPDLERDDGTGRIWNVSVPDMRVYLPTTRPSEPGMAIVFCPGGGYTHLTRLDGADGLVDEFGPRGVTIISLKYRLRPASDDVERDAMADAQRAIQLIRYHAKEWNIDPNRVGLIGASAGSNVGLNVASNPEATNFESADPIARESSRPAFVVLLCPWPDGQAIAKYPIHKNSPPAFIASARDDKTAPTAFAQAIADEYQNAALEHCLWLVDTGGHGAFTLGGTSEGSRWPEKVGDWLRDIGMKPPRLSVTQADASVHS